MSERSQTHATFVLERYYPVPVERVWDAFADPEMKRQWFGSGDFVERERREDFRVGGVAIRRRHAVGRAARCRSSARPTPTSRRTNGSSTPTTCGSTVSTRRRRSRRSFSSRPRTATVRAPD